MPHHEPFANCLRPVRGHIRDIPAPAGRSGLAGLHIAARDLVSSAALDPKAD